MKPNNEGTECTTHRILRLVLDDLGLGCKYVGRTRKILSALGRASNLEYWAVTGQCYFIYGLRLEDY